MFTATSAKKVKVDHRDSVDAPFEDGSLVFTEGYKPPSYEGLQEATIRAQMNQPTSIFMECNWWIFCCLCSNETNH